MYQRRWNISGAALTGLPGVASILTIRFVRASEGAISGMLDPYWDPDRNCEARTVFSGTLVDWSIEGTLTTFDCGSGGGHRPLARHPQARIDGGSPWSMNAPTT